MVQLTLLQLVSGKFLNSNIDLTLAFLTEIFLRCPNRYNICQCWDIRLKRSTAAPLNIVVM
jgi:hypothetical protein